MKYSMIFLIIATGFFMSCKKGDLQFELEGRVLLSSNQEAVKGAKVKIFSYSLGNAVKKEIASKTTDNNGFYKISIERDQFEKIDIVVEKELCFPYEQTVNFDDLSTQDVNQYDLKIDAQSWAKFLIKNQTEAQESDQLKWIKTAGKTDCDDCCHHGEYIFHGIVDTSMVCANNGGEYIAFYHWKNNEENFELDSVYTEPYDTTVYEVIY